MKELKPKEKFFTWPDAWVFASLSGATSEAGQFSFSSLIATGDMLNHAIMTNEEIKQGLTKLYICGLVEIDEENINITKLAEIVYAKAKKRRGGLFSVVDNCLSVLNSPRTELADIKVVPELDFIIENHLR